MTMLTRKPKATSIALIMIAMMLLSTHGYAPPEELVEDTRKDSRSAPTGSMTMTFNRTHVGWNDTILIHHALSGLSSAHTYEVSWRICEGNAMVHGCHDEAYELSDGGQNALFEGTHTVPTGVTSFLVVHTLHANVTRAAGSSAPYNGTYTLLAEMTSNTFVVDEDEQVFQSVGEGSAHWSAEDSPVGNNQPYLNQSAYMVNDPISAIIETGVACDPVSVWGIHWQILDDDAGGNAVTTSSLSETVTCTHRYVYSRGAWDPNSATLSRGIELSSTGLSDGNYTVVIDLVQEDSGITVLSKEIQFQVLDVQFTGNEALAVTFDSRYADSSSGTFDLQFDVSGLATDIPYQVDWWICSSNHTRRGCYQQAYVVNSSGGQNELASGTEAIALGSTSDTISLQVSSTLATYDYASHAANGTYSVMVALTAFSYTLDSSEDAVLVVGPDGAAHWATAKGHDELPYLDNSGYLHNTSISMDIRVAVSCDPNPEWRVAWTITDTSDSSIVVDDGVERHFSCSAYYPWDKHYWQVSTPGNNNLLMLSQSGLETGDYRATVSLVQNDSATTVLTHSIDFKVVDITITSNEALVLSMDANHVPWGTTVTATINLTGLVSSQTYEVVYQVCGGDADTAGCRDPMYWVKMDGVTLLDAGGTEPVPGDSEGAEFGIPVPTRLVLENSPNSRPNGTYSIIFHVRSETHTLLATHTEVMVIGTPDAAHWETYGQVGGIPALDADAYLENTSISLDVQARVSCSPASIWSIKSTVTNLDNSTTEKSNWGERSVSCDPYSRWDKWHISWFTEDNYALLELHSGLPSGNYSVVVSLVQNDSGVEVLTETYEFRVVGDWEVLDESMISLVTGPLDDYAEVYANFSMVNQMEDEWYNVDWALVNSTDWTEVDNGTFGYLSISDEHVRNETIVGVVGEGYCINATLRKGQDVIKDTASACSSAIQPPPDEDDDGVPDSADACPGTEDGWVVDATGCAENQIDDDGDGVFNHNDTCIDTDSANWTVDVDGCADNQKDSDADGVTDDLDQCPGTNPGEVVDATGCTQLQLADTDGDGVNDQDDECASTPATDVATVNDVGCGSTERDGDGDGWVDAEDDCPNTPAGAVIEDRGCQSDTIDTDQDGVVDINDLCPNTPGGPVALITVDADGCAESQKDDDGDLVMNDIDNCTETDSANWTVDAEGCAANQLDSDGDGVTNDLDICPNSAFGMTVDAVGCEDSDGDAVNEHDDVCPGTLATESALVDDVGCGPSQRDTDGDSVNDADDLCPEVPGLTKRGGCPPNTPPVCSVYASAKADGIVATGDAVLPTLDLTIIPTIDLPTGEYYLILKCWDEDGSNVTVNLNGIEESGEEVVLGTLVSIDENTEPMDVNAQFSDGETTKTISLRVRFKSDAQTTPGFGAFASMIALLGAASAMHRRRE